MLATGYLLAKPAKSMAGGPASSFLSRYFNLNKVEILHTGNLHGNLNPIALGELNNIGGLHNVHTVVKNNSNTPLLVDAGGFLNGKQSVSHDVSMISQMNKTGYTAVTIGNNELTNGEAYLASLMQHMNFAVVNCNYHFGDAALKAKVQPYLVVRNGQYKIGITGVGPVQSNIACSQPAKKANEVAGYLKSQLNCDLVICLSQLGFEQKGGNAANKAFAAATENIDIIIAGNDIGVVNPQLILKNNEKKQVVLSTGGYGGAVLGAVTFGFNSDRGLQTFNCKNYVPGATALSFYDNYVKLTA